MKNPFTPEALRAAAALVITLDHHRFGATMFLAMVLALAAGFVLG